MNDPPPAFLPSGQPIVWVTAFAMLFGVDFPDFLHAKAVFLRLFACRQVVFGNHLFGQRPAHPFGQEHVFAVQFHARLSAFTDGLPSASTPNTPATTPLTSPLSP